MSKDYEVTTHPRSATELHELQNLLKSIAAEQRDSVDDEGFGEWLQAALYELQYDPVVEAAGLDQETWSKHKLIHAGSQRTYRTHLHLSSTWGTGDLAQRVMSIVQVALDRVAIGRTRAFMSRAKQNGSLVGRRSKSRPFPHPLPYASPAPTTPDGRYAEEAGLIAAAFHFPLSMPSPGIPLYLTRFDKAATSGGWNRGRAPTDQYNYEKNLLIRLNGRALEEANFSDDEWSGVVAHELMHNLGWGHGVGDYSKKLAIETYEWAVSRIAPIG